MTFKSKLDNFEINYKFVLISGLICAFLQIISIYFYLPIDDWLVQNGFYGKIRIALVFAQGGILGLYAALAIPYAIALKLKSSKTPERQQFKKTSIAIQLILIIVVLLITTLFLILYFGGKHFHS